jgi:hypothetical protein
VTRLQSINLIRRFSGQVLAVQGHCDWAVCERAVSPKRMRLALRPALHQLRGASLGGRDALKRLSRRLMTEAKHHRGMPSSSRRTLMALGGLRDTPSYCVLLSAAGRVCNLAGNRQGLRAARDIRRGLSWRHSTLCCSHWWARQDFEVLATWSQSVARRW